MVLTEDRLSPRNVCRLDPDLSREPLKVTKASFQVVAEHLAANALLFKPLLLDVGLSRVCGGGKANKIMRIFGGLHFGL